MGSTIPQRYSPSLSYDSNLFSRGLAQNIAMPEQGGGPSLDTRILSTIGPAVPKSPVSRFLAKTPPRLLQKAVKGVVEQNFNPAQNLFTSPTEDSCEEEEEEIEEWELPPDWAPLMLENISGLPDPTIGEYESQN